MNRLRIQVSLMAGLAMIVTADVTPVAADSVRVPIRSANARTTQLDPNALPAPAPEIPLPVAPRPGLPPAVGGPLPPPPMPDQSIPDQPLPIQPIPDSQAPPASRGGVMFRGPLGADFQREEAPKRPYLGDGHGRPRSQPLPSVHGQPEAVIDPGTVSGPFAGTDRYGIAPPAGTLGQTYQRRSRLIDDEKHPRMAGVEVHLSENYDVSATGLKAKWTGKVWHLSNEALLPGIPHIYEVKAEWGPEGAKQHEIRAVRLIMNRVVDLEF